VGAVPSIGGARRDPVVIDSRLAERESVVLEAGSHQESVRIATADLLRLTNADVASICAG
jgi:prolyl-tRNA editing enzyme YbaK/EbsC (Cys-tRNA(Pro) deacylase)